MLTHIDIEIYKNCKKEFFKDPENKPRDIIDFINKYSALRIYGEKNEQNLNLLNPDIFSGSGDSKKPVWSNSKFSTDKVEKNNPYQLFFLNIKDKKEQESLRQQLKLLVGFTDDYEEVFANFKEEAIYRVDHETESNNKFQSWEQVLPKVPVSDVIICDRFLLEENDEYSIIDNYLKLIRTIEKIYKIERLLFFTSHHSFESLKNKNIDIIGKSKEILGKKVIFGLIFFPKGGSEHDRHIILNYHHISLGSSPNFFFKKTGTLSVKNKSNINVESFYYTKSWNNTKDVLAFLRDILMNNKQIRKYQIIFRAIYLTLTLISFMSNFTLNPKYITKKDAQIIELIKNKIKDFKSIASTGHGKKYIINYVSATSIKYTGMDRNEGEKEDISFDDIKTSIAILKMLQSFNTNSSILKEKIPRAIYKKEAHCLLFFLQHISL